MIRFIHAIDHAFENRAIPLSSMHMKKNRQLPAFILLLALLITCGGAVLMKEQWTHQKAQEDATRLNWLNQEWPEQRTALKRKLEAWDETHAMHALTQAHFSDLEAALKTTRNWIREHPGVEYPEFSELQQKAALYLENHACESLWTQVNDHERQALEQKAIPENAWPHMEAALEAQKTINRQYPQSPRASFLRESELESQWASLKSQPLAEQLREHMERAQAEMDAQNWDLAMDTWHQALELQRAINHQFPKSTHADIRATVSMDHKILQCSCGKWAMDRTTLEQQATAWLEQGQKDKAMDSWRHALDLQSRINRLDELNRFASTEKEQFLMTQIQNIASQGLIETILTRNLELDRKLRSQDILQACALAKSLAQSLAEIDREFPLSEHTPALEPIRPRIQFLTECQGDLEWVAAWAKTHLTPFNIPEGSTLSPLIPQSVYLRVMGNNPSRIPSDDQPVDSVSYPEAMAFAERMGWLLSSRMELPAWREVAATNLVEKTFSEWTSDIGSDDTRGIRDATSEHQSPLFFPKAHRARSLSFRIKNQPLNIIP
jgi:tetratricopeptide (TPR) repeat protein